MLSEKKINIWNTFLFRGLSFYGAVCIYMLHALAPCPYCMSRCMSLVNVQASCQCCFPKLHVSSACETYTCFKTMLNVPTACPCLFRIFKLHVHASCLSFMCMPPFHAACEYRLCMPRSHAVFPCCMFMPHVRATFSCWISCYQSILHSHRYCISMLHALAPCPCCMSKVHVSGACPSCMSMLLPQAACL
jgi:hypothetical protein